MYLYATRRINNDDTAFTNSRAGRVHSYLMAAEARKLKSFLWKHSEALRGVECLHTSPADSDAN
jgi:hypothetical protein